MSATRYGDAVIPALEALEAGLGTVPGCDLRDPRFKEPDAEWRLRWFDWRDRAERIAAQLNIAAADNPTLQGSEREECARDWAYCAAMYSWTYDPRLREGQNPDKPFTPFAIQVHKINEIQRVVHEPRKSDTYDSKSRGIGWTDTYAEAALCGWTFTDHSYHFVSYKAEKVWKRNDRATIFGKILYKLDRRPAWLLPRGFDPDSHVLMMNLYNPETGASITGETTTERTARGDRRTAIFYDEAAFVEGGFLPIWGVGAGTTNHRFAWSTESYDQGDDWEVLWQTEKKEGDPQRVWEVDWWHNPYQDSAWYAEEKARWKNDPYGFTREYERDAEAAESGLMYPAARLWQGTPEHHDPTKVLLVGIDPGSTQDTAIVWGQPRHLDDGRKGILWLGSYKRKLVPVAFYAHLLLGIPPEPGDPCWGLWQDDQFSERDRRLMAWFGERTRAEANRSEWVYLTGDPAGKQAHTQFGSSFFELFDDATRELLVRQWERDGKKGPKPRGLIVDYQVLAATGNLIVDRVLTTQHFLAASDYSTADPELWRAEDVQLALRKSKYTESTPRSVSQPKPVHGDESHTRTAVEFVSFGLYTGMEAPPKRIARQMLDALKKAA